MQPLEPAYGIRVDHDTPYSDAIVTVIEVKRFTDSRHENSFANHFISGKRFR